MDGWFVGLFALIVLVLLDCGFVCHGGVRCTLLVAVLTYVFILICSPDGLDSNAVVWVCL